MMDVIGAKAFIPIWHSFLCPVYDSQMIFLFSVVFSFMTVVDNKLNDTILVLTSIMLSPVLIWFNLDISQFSYSLNNPKMVSETVGHAQKPI